MLQFIDTQKQFISKGDVWTLGPLNFEIQKGEFIAVLGHSGSGKSTLLHLAGGLIRPTQGAVLMNQQSLYQLSDNQLSFYRNQKMGFVFQDFYLLSDQNVFLNVAMPLLIQGKQNLQAVTAKVIKALEKVSLEDFIHRYPAELSGGQKQRVAIARAFVHQPEIILADEPTGNLDEETGSQIIDLLKQFNQTEKMTIICVTHDMQIAQQAGRVLKIQNGQII